MPSLILTTTRRCGSTRWESPRELDWVSAHPFVLVLFALLASIGIASGEGSVLTYDGAGNFQEATTGSLSWSFVERQICLVPNEVEPELDAERGRGRH